jgi:hypothetical protein
MRCLLLTSAVAVALVPATARAADKADIDKAISRGVTALREMQKTDGRWDFPTPSASAGCTALAGLTLLECGAEKDDPAILSAATYVRSQVPGLHYTYSVALSIIFFDRLGDPKDEPLIDTLAARLVGGQCTTGAWTYQVPDPAAIDVQIQQRAAAEELQKAAGAKGQLSEDARRRRDFLQRVLLLKAQAAGQSPAVSRGDNSNTMFAIMALWISRRHGLPVENCLRDAAIRFRLSQHPDGGWQYADDGAAPGVEPTSTPSMTCAGILSLAVGFGVKMDQETDKKPARDGSKDLNLIMALRYLSVFIGVPREVQPGARDAQAIKSAVNVDKNNNRFYYLLWGIERVAVALNLEKIGNKDWYGWGSDYLVVTQTDKGTWEGAHWQGGADTCFALLFLKKANIATDLSRITGRMIDGGRTELRSGQIGGDTRSDPADPRNGAGDTRVPAGGNRVGGDLPLDQPKGPPSLGNTPGAKLAAALLDLPADRQETQIDRLRDHKGSENTEALATAIPYLDVEPRKKAREALAERVARMKAETVGSYLQDDEPEIRRAAAVACAIKEARQLVPQLIPLLNDREVVVSRAAYAALKDLTGQDFGPSAAADDAERRRAVGEWQAWWKKQGR